MFISLPQRKHSHLTFWGLPVHSGLAVRTGHQTILCSPCNLCPPLSHSTEAVNKEIKKLNFFYSNHKQKTKLEITQYVREQLGNLLE